MDTLRLRNKLTNGHDLSIEECEYLKSLMSVVVKGEKALCPFGCIGGKLGLYQLPDSNSRHVFCETCGASGPWGETNEEAERLWNERTVVFTEQERNDLIDDDMIAKLNAMQPQE